MPALLIRHKVNDFEKWKPVFDELDATRRAHGCQGGWIFRNDYEPSETFVLLKWDDLDRARLFVQSDDLRDAMNQGGVVDEPDFWFLEDTETTID